MQKVISNRLLYRTELYSSELFKIILYCTGQKKAKLWHYTEIYNAWQWQRSSLLRSILKTRTRHVSQSASI